MAEFSNTEDYEVLYEVPAVSRYFMRSLPGESLAQRDLQGIAAPNGGEGDAEIGLGGAAGGLPAAISFLR